MAIWGYRIQCFDVFAVICGIICSAIYSWYIGSWLQGMSIGPLMFILGWISYYSPLQSPLAFCRYACLYFRLQGHRKRPQVLGADLNRCSG